MTATDVRTPAPVRVPFQRPALRQARNPGNVAVPPDILAVIASGLAASPTTEAVDPAGAGE